LSVDTTFHIDQELGQVGVSGISGGLITGSFGCVSYGFTTLSFQLLDC
jgi:hypothetical protein